MLVRLYHPKIIEDVSKVKCLGNDFQKYGFSLIQAAANPKTRNDNQAQIDRMNACLNELQKANEVLQMKIVDAIKDFI